MRIWGGRKRTGRVCAKHHRAQMWGQTEIHRGGPDERISRRVKRGDGTDPIRLRYRKLESGVKGEEPIR